MTALLSRVRKIADITGVGVSTQRRYDARFNNSTVVRSLSVSLGRPPISYVRGMVWANRHLGFFIGRQGALMRRHGNIRRANQLMGSRRSSGQLNRKLKANHRPVDEARGQRALRAYFAERHKGATGWMRAKRALGKVPNQRRSSTCDLDHGAGPVQDAASIFRRRRGHVNVDLGDADAAVGISLGVITDFLRELARLGRFPTSREFDRDLGRQTVHVLVLLDPPAFHPGVSPG